MHYVSSLQLSLSIQMFPDVSADVYNVYRFMSWKIHCRARQTRPNACVCVVQYMNMYMYT